MKKLLLFLSVICIGPVMAMESPKPRKRKLQPFETEARIVYQNQAAIAPFRVLAFYGTQRAGSIYFNEYSSNPRYGHLDYLNVIEEYRGQGIGYQLFKRAISSLKKKGYEAIVWDVGAIDTTPLDDLEEIYLAYVEKLKKELSFDFLKEQRIGVDGIELIPMKIILR